MPNFYENHSVDRKTWASRATVGPEILWMSCTVFSYDANTCVYCASARLANRLIRCSSLIALLPPAMLNTAFRILPRCVSLSCPKCMCCEIFTCQIFVGTFCVCVHVIYVNDIIFWMCVSAIHFSFNVIANRSTFLMLYRTETTHRKVYRKRMS